MCMVIDYLFQAVETLPAFHLKFLLVLTLCILRYLYNNVQYIAAVYSSIYAVYLASLFKVEGKPINCWIAK